MASAVQNAVNAMESYTNQMKAKEDKVLGANQELGQDAFLELMMQQLKYQDPMDPMDNSEFLTQQAQFTQVSALEEIKTSLSTFNQYAQASGLVGQDVVLKDPNNETNFFYGKVDAVNFGGTSTSVYVNGKEYPLSSVVQLYANNVLTSAANTATAE